MKKLGILQSLKNSSNLSDYQQFSNIVRYSQIFSNILRYSQIFSNILRYSQIFSDILKYCQIFADILENPVFPTIETFCRTESIQLRGHQSKYKGSMQLITDGMKDCEQILGRMRTGLASVSSFIIQSDSPYG